MESQTKPSGLGAALGMERVVDSGASGHAILHYRATMDMCHSGGIVQGGFVTGWIDAAMAHVVIASSNREVSPLTLEIKVSFFAPGRPGLVVAEAWIERRGKTLAFLEGTLKNEVGELLAKASSTVRLVPLRVAAPE
jgi:acyl-CoA thioesterase